MMTNLRLILTTVVLCALICGFIGAIAGIGTSILLPGLGLIVAGPLIFGLIGVILGAILGLLIAAIIIIVRRRNYA